MGSIYIILAPHCEHYETGCYIIDTGCFFFFLNTMFYLNIKKISDWAESFLTPYFSNMFKNNKKLKKTKLNQEVKWQKEKEKRREIKIKHSV